ncbi:glucan biosynthesis protein, partial [Salmonella enterica subsp. enterica serovar Virginia]|nr:glucan biosynthesis protein [Salmonella enterica subsp. enterica serovar Virginia]
SWAFSIDDVAKQAQSLAGKGYEAPKSNLPSVFRDMKYADYQQNTIRPIKVSGILQKNWRSLCLTKKMRILMSGIFLNQNYIKLW